ncbi:Dabb family protein [Nocardia sp. R7R-8]|uniref:Dabb family protein n=1 Tax=Nocardia sp. R7R-8 TaxID=3459304 RepID=UPI00403D7476
MSELLHLVLFRPHDAVSAAALDTAMADLRAFAAGVEGVLDVRAGADVSIEGLSSGYTHAAVVTFADEGVRDRYLAAPGHVALGERLGRLLDGIAVVDLAAGVSIR